MKNPVTGNEYGVIDRSMSWTEARDYCESLGGHLVTIRDEQENGFVLEQVRERGEKNLYWLGLAGYGERYCWISGEPEEYRNFAEGEPNSQSETVAHLYRLGQNGGKPGEWNDTYNEYDGWAEFYRTKNSGIVCEWETGGRSR